jgi:hypothetical protein
VLKCGDVVKVVVGADSNGFHKIKYGNQFCYTSTKYTKVKDYLALVGKYATQVYDKIVTLGCKHQSGACNYSQLISKKTTTCAVSVSCALQLGGLLKENKLVSHTAAVGNGKAVNYKSTKAKAISGVSNLIDGTYTICKCGKVYSKIESKYKRKGMVYVYDSNIAINAGNNYIYSTNNGSSELKNGKYIKDKVNSGYCFTSPILYIIVPNS